MEILTDEILMLELHVALMIHFIARPLLFQAGSVSLNQQQRIPLITWCSEATTSLISASVCIEWEIYNRQIVVIDIQQLQWREVERIAESLLATIICLELKPSDDCISNKKRKVFFCFLLSLRTETNCCACDKKGSTEEQRNIETRRLIK